MDRKIKSPPLLRFAIVGVKNRRKKWQYRTPLHPGNIKKCNAPV